MGRGEFCKVVGEGLFTRISIWYLYDCLGMQIIYNKLKKIYDKILEISDRCKDSEGEVYLRVIAGKAKGKRLKAPPGLTTRPVTDMVKEALFNVLGRDVAGSRLLDLFAGSGSIGIEALSRGADQVVFIDRDAKATQVIKENLDNCKFDLHCYEIYRNDVFRALDILERKNNRFDYVYIDPPFNHEEIFAQILYRLDKGQVIDKDGRMIIRTRCKKKLPLDLGCLKEYRADKYGESTLHYYKHINEEDINL